MVLRVEPRLLVEGRKMLSLLLLAGTMPFTTPPQSGGEAHVLRREPGDVIEARGGLGKDWLAPGRDAYVPPVPGWRYRTLRRGQRLSPVFYTARYTIAEPSRYGLPEARGDRRWIRYGPDLVLLNTRSGIVLRIVPRSRP